ncbi:hypothetical protein KIJ05_08875 [Leuconostoc gelidum subsp. gasicomitatum]|uniref:hypothetical protein n=1 Tax=Leuconostoc gasicomitatum TaxID=115778 RepID=UPI001CC6E536|nr:hypothetical protein [Leuconostoc gasicomitatum]MBZ5985223.1 hypothetical protein [Leuconostoc gasicomitatum]
MELSQIYSLVYDNNKLDSFIKNQCNLSIDVSFSELLDLFILKSLLEQKNYWNTDKSLNVDEYISNLKKKISKTLNTTFHLANSLITNFLKLNKDDATKKSLYFNKLFTENKLWIHLEDNEFKLFLNSAYAELSCVLSDKQVADKFANIIVDFFVEPKDKLTILSNFLFIRSAIFNDFDSLIYFPKNFGKKYCFQIMVNKFMDSILPLTPDKTLLLADLTLVNDKNFYLNEVTKTKIEYTLEKFVNSSQSLSTKNWGVAVQFGKYDHYSQKSSNVVSITINKNALDLTHTDVLLVYLISVYFNDKYYRNNTVGVIRSDTIFSELFVDNVNKYSSLFNNQEYFETYNLALIDKFSIYLKKRNTSFEKLIFNFFDKYIPNTFNIQDFRVALVDDALPSETKNKLFVIEIESILRQFILLQKENKIDVNNLKYMHQPRYDNIHSFVKNKYLEIDQNSVFKYFQDDNKILRIFNSFNYVEEKFLSKTTLNSILETTIRVNRYSNLFSTSESNYLSYCLDNSLFSDALALRNIYLHGASKHFSDEDHRINYLRILNCMLIIIANINDELIYKIDTLEKIETNN